MKSLLTCLYFNFCGATSCIVYVVPLNCKELFVYFQIINIKYIYNNRLIDLFCWSKDLTSMFKVVCIYVVKKRITIVHVFTTEANLSTHFHFSMNVKIKFQVFQFQFHSSSKMYATET